MSTVTYARSLGSVLDYFVYPHDAASCDCDLRPTMAFACASHWCRQQVLLRGAFELGPATFRLEALDCEAAVAEVGLRRWSGHHGAGGTSRLTVRLRGDNERKATARSRADATSQTTAEGSPALGSEDIAHDAALPVSPSLPLAAVVAWWKPCGLSVQLEGMRSTVRQIRELVRVVQAEWASADCLVTGLRVQGYNDADSASKENEDVLWLMEATADTLRALEVEGLGAVPPSRSKHCARESGEAGEEAGVAVRHLRRLSLDNFTGDLRDVGVWLRSSPLEALYLCGGSPFRSFTTSTASAAGASAQQEQLLLPLAPPGLRRLMLDGTDVTPRHLELLRCRASLQSLSLIDCHAVEEVDLTGMCELRSLLLSRAPIASTESLVGLAQCQALRLLNVAGCVALADLNELAQLPQLRELFAYQTGLTNDGIRALSCCKQLEKINFGGCARLTDVTPLGTLTALKQLHLWGTRVNNQGIAALSGCASLSELVLDDCTRVTGVNALGGLPSLRFLSLISTSVTRNGVSALVGCPALEVLAVAGTDIAETRRMWSHDAVLRFLESKTVGL